MMKLTVASTIVLVLTAGTTGCIGGRYETQVPASELDQATRDLMTDIGAARAAKNLPPPTWVQDLRPPAARGALGVARGDISLKTAAHQSALAAVTEMGRHVWSFVAECPEGSKVQLPPMALGGQTLLVGASVVPFGVGKSVVVLLIAEPGTASLRADRMGGGGGGTNRPLEAYAHPSVASGPCGASWPAASPVRW